MIFPSNMTWVCLRNVAKMMWNDDFGTQWDWSRQTRLPWQQDIDLVPPGQSSTPGWHHAFDNFNLSTRSSHMRYSTSVFYNMTTIWLTVAVDILVPSRSQGTCGYKRTSKQVLLSCSYMTTLHWHQRVAYQLRVWGMSLGGSCWGFYPGTLS